MKAPEAAIRPAAPGGDVVAGLAVVLVEPPARVVPVAAATDDVVAGSVDDVLGAAEVAVVSAGAVDVDGSALFRSDPEEQPAAVTARMRKRTRRFTGAHHRAPTQTPFSTSAMSSPISDGLRPTRHPAFSRASILAAAVPLEPETMAPAWPIFFPGGAVTPAT
jgi:hypothetical protein